MSDFDHAIERVKRLEDEKSQAERERYPGIEDLPWHLKGSYRRAIDNQDFKRATKLLTAAQKLAESQQRYRLIKEGRDPETLKQWQEAWDTLDAEVRGAWIKAGYSRDCYVSSKPPEPISVTTILKGVFWGSILVFSILLAANLASADTRLDTAKGLTSAQREAMAGQRVHGRAPISDVTCDGDACIVHLSDDDIHVYGVPKSEALKLKEGQGYDYSGVVKKGTTWLFHDLRVQHDPKPVRPRTTVIRNFGVEEGEVLRRAQRRQRVRARMSPEEVREARRQSYHTTLLLDCQRAIQHGNPGARFQGPMQIAPMREGVGMTAWGRVRTREHGEVNYRCDAGDTVEHKWRLYR